VPPPLRALRSVPLWLPLTLFAAAPPALAASVAASFAGSFAGDSPFVPDFAGGAVADDPLEPACLRVTGFAPGRFAGAWSATGAASGRTGFWPGRGALA
jgi:hypothetical protein